MAKAQDLMGLGMPGVLAGTLGYTPVSITAAGATVAAGTTLFPGSHLFLVTAASSTAAAATFSTNIASTTPVFVVNLVASGVTASIFAPATGTMNGTTGGSVTLTTGQMGVFIQTTANVWIGGKLS